MISDKIFQLLVTSSVKVTLICAVVYGLIILLKRNSASLRHWLLALTLLSALLIPILTVAMPAWWVAILPEAPVAASKSWFSLTSLNALSNTDKLISAVQKAQTNPPSVDTQKSTATQSTGLPTYKVAPSTKQPIASSDFRLTWLDGIVIVWLVGVLITLTRRIIQMSQVWRLTRQGGRPIDSAWQRLCRELTNSLRISRPVRVIMSTQVATPMTWGVWRPVIVLPVAAADWSPSRRRIVLLHELVHIARWDYLMHWLALVSCAVYWFNPLLSKIAQRLSIERERACDDQVLTLGTKSSEYAHNLLEISLAMRQAILPGVLAMAQSSDLARRIRYILDIGQSRHPLTRRRCISLLLLLSMLLLPLSTMQFTHVSAQNNGITLTVAVPPDMKDQIDQNLLQEFVAANPGITVTVVDNRPVELASFGLTAHFNDMQKLASSADLIFFRSYEGLELSPLDTRAGYILDLAPLINSDPTLKVDDFLPQLWSAFQWDRGIWALPVSADLAMMSYDRTAFDKLGLPYPDNKWALQDFVNTVNKLAIKDTNGHVITPGFANSGKIFRLPLYRSLIGTNLVDDSVIPNQPKLDMPNVETVMDADKQLEQQGLIGGDPAIVPMSVLSVNDRLFSAPNRGAALLPGGKAEVITSAFAISGGTQHPEQAYALLKYFSTRGELNQDGLPTRKSVFAAGKYKVRYPATMQPLVDQGLANSLNFADMRFAEYLDQVHFTTSGAIRDAIQATETQLVNDAKAASDKKATLVLTIVEPVAAVVPPGKIALKFDMSTDFYVPNIGRSLPNKEAWDKVIKEFTDSDPQVGLIDLKVTSDTISEAVTKSDCFYLPENAVPTAATNSLLSLDPLMNADASLDRADFINGILASVQRDNKTYAIPLDLKPMILRYDGARFKTANLPEPAGTWTVEAFNDALKALKPNAQTDSPFADVGTNGAYLLVLMAAYGGIPVDYRTNPLTINFTDPTAVTAIRQVLDLAKNNYLKYSPLGSITGGISYSPNNMTAIYPSALDAFSPVKKSPGLDANKPVLFPTGRQYNGVAYNLGTAYISTQAQNPEACYRFISTLSKHPELFLAMPVRHSSLASPTLAATTNPDVLALYRQIDTLLKDPHTVAFPAFNKGTITISALMVQHWLFEAFDAYVLNSGDLDVALKNAETYANGFQACIANLPVLTTASASRNDTAEVTKQYIDCAEKVDARLKPVLDPLRGN